MISFPTRWSNSLPESPPDRIDRAILNRTQRLMAGIAVEPSFEKVHGALTVTVGFGKHLRLQHLVESEMAIPAPICRSLRELSESENVSNAEIAPVLQDLAEIQARLVSKVVRQAGKYVDRVLAVAVVDPGLRNLDFDGRVSYRPLVDATQLAELSGLSVIDAFPARDIAVGGSGSHLEALPLWLLIADRNHRVADHHRLVLPPNGLPLAYYLPASDGLDSELPPIKQIPISGFNYLRELVNRTGETLAPNISENLAHTNSQTELSGRIHAVLTLPSLKNMRPVSPPPVHSGEMKSVDQSLREIGEEFLHTHPQQISELIRATAQGVLRSLSVALSNLGNLSEVVLVPSKPSAAGDKQMLDLISRHHPYSGITFRFATEVGDCSLDSVTAAMLGLLHVDQIPANVPWLTGAHSQRILGRLTPGRPASWRQLLRAMSDFQPAAMKLKDAV